MLEEEPGHDAHIKEISVGAMSSHQVEASLVAISPPEEHSWVLVFPWDALGLLCREDGEGDPVIRRKWV